MADAHFEEHSSPSKTAKEAIFIMLLTIVVSAVSILLIVKLISGGMKIDHGSAELSEDAIAHRLKPVGQVSVAFGPVDTNIASDKSSEQLGQPADSGDASTKVAASGEQIYNTFCVACHATGVGGAPKIGDKAAWKARIAQGIDALYASAIGGKNAMPPKGGAMSTPDDNIKSAVDFMVSKSR